MCPRTSWATPALWYAHSCVSGWRVLSAISIASVANLRDFPEHVGGATILAEAGAGAAQVHARRDAEREVAQRLRMLAGLLTCLDGALVVGNEAQAVCRKRQRPGPAPIIPDPAGELLGFAQVFERAVRLGERGQGVSQIEAEIDGLLLVLSPLGQVGQRSHGLLVAGRRLGIG
jgi:hypothetical protein